MSAQASAGATQLQPFGLHYRVPPECPGSLTFQLHVRARTSFITFAAEPDRGAHAFHVEVEKSGDGYVGRIARDPGSGEAQVQAATCDEVIAGLALVAALSVDAQAATMAEASPEAAPPPDPEPKPVEAFALGAALAVRGGVAHAVSPGVGVVAAQPWPPAHDAWALRVGWRLGLYGFLLPEQHTLGTTSGGTLWSVRAALCPLALSANSLRAALCGGAELGWRRAWFQTPARGARDHTFWSTVGPGITASIGVASELELELNGMIDVPITHAQYRYRTGIGDYHTPVVTWTAEVAMRWTIW